jgi:hypothetical protein
MQAVALGTNPKVAAAVFKNGSHYIVNKGVGISRIVFVLGKRFCLPVEFV